MALPMDSVGFVVDRGSMDLGSVKDVFTVKFNASKHTGDGVVGGGGGLQIGGCIFLNHSSTILGTLCGRPGGRRAGGRSWRGCTETTIEFSGCLVGWAR